MSLQGLQCTIGSTAGTLTQLLATGAIDAQLNGSATEQGVFSPWKVKFNKHTKFSMNTDCVQFNGTVGFDQQVTCTIPRVGDLMYWMYVVINIPGIYASSECSDKARYGTPVSDIEKVRVVADGDCDCSANNADEEDCDDDLGDFVHYTNAIGQALVHVASIKVGNQPVDTMYAEWLFCWEELSGKSGKRLLEMIGKRYTRRSLICDSAKNRTLYVPLPFYFTSHPGVALPLCALQFHGVTCDIKFQKREQVIVRSSSDVGPMDCEKKESLRNDSLSAQLEICYVYLDQDERTLFANSSRDVIITHLQRHTIHAKDNVGQISQTLAFNHPCKELIFLVRRLDMRDSGNYFDFSGLGGQDPIEFASLSLNNQLRFARTGNWLRTVSCWQHHTNVPDTYIYSYSFAIDPESLAPSGSCNMSRIDSVILDITLQENLPACEIIVFAPNFNILRCRDGIAGLAYAA
jgi:hypothetical protein